MAHSAPAKPSQPSSKPPTRNPNPLSAFFEPVRMATHLNSAESFLSVTRSLIALLELIFVKSLAMPERA